MEKIIIKDKDKNTIILINSKFYYGYTMNPFSVIPCIEDLSSIFSCFSLSNKHTPFKKEGKYHVCIDLLSGFKHYFYQGKEEYYQFFIHNSSPTTVYKDKKEHPFNLNDMRFFSTGEKVVICSFLAFLFFSVYSPSFIPNFKSVSQNVVSSYTQDYSLDYVRDAIYSSPFLTVEEKDFLYNPEFLKLVVDTVNQSNIAKSHFSSYIHDISIKSFVSEDSSTPSGGLYQLNNPSTIYINSYKGLSEANQDTVAHEFVHLCQDTTGYNLIIEASAEIISHEFYSDTKERSYSHQVQLLKKLMEIIGSDPVWYYNFTGDFSKIEENVRPYLSNKEYKDFLNSLTFDYHFSADNKPVYDRLEELLEILYKNKYHQDMKDNPIFSYIDHDSFHLHRYYFNPILKEESYYIDYSQGETKKLSYEEAIDANIIQVYATQKTPIDQDTAIEFANNREAVLERVLKQNENSSYILRSQYSGYKMFVSAVINGIRIDDVDVDELVEDGLIDADYYIVKQKKLTSEEYHNNDYWDDAEFLTTMNSGTQLQDDCVIGFVPKKIILPPVGECDKIIEKVLY